MAQISRKELKSDEFVSGMDAALEFFLQHQTSLIVAAVVFVVVIVSGYGVYAWRGSRNRAASALLAQGLTTLHAPLQGASQADSPATAPGTTVYATVASRAAVAAQQFQAVIAGYGSTDAGQLASYYLGLAQLDESDPHALQTLQAAEASSDPVASTAAKHALANLYIERNQPAQAHALLLALSKQNSPTLPRAVVLMELADLDRTYNPKEAAQFYRQLQADYPSTATAEQAQQQLASLGK